MNYYPDRDGHIAALDEESTTTSEMLQAHLPESFVVKAFNNIFYQHLGALARPADAPDRSALAIAGDNAAAKARVAELLDHIGYDTVDLGPLAEGGGLSATPLPMGPLCRRRGQLDHRRQTCRCGRTLRAGGPGEALPRRLAGRLSRLPPAVALVEDGHQHC